MYWQYLLPQHLLSRAVGYVAHCRIAWIKNSFIQWFIRRYQVDMREALEQDPLQYATFNAFFTRALHPDLRTIAEGAHTIASPADGAISQIGKIRAGRIFQAKGFDFDLCRLLGGDEKIAAPFHAGSFATIYLAPKDYHRVHMPCAGKLREMFYIPGQLFSVNTQSAARIPNLFARNERVVALFDTPHGEMAMVLVGAMIVASIETTWAGLIAPARQRTTQHWRYTGAEIAFEKGDEMGRFQLGSTVLVLFASPHVRWNKQIQADSVLMMGQELGTEKQTT
jgi:phosphatidylserine decarboxylase